MHHCHSDHPTVGHTLQADLESISMWMTVSRLKPKVSESCCILIISLQGTGEKFLHLMLNDDLLRQVPTIKYLCIHVDQHFTWNTQIAGTDLDF